MKTVVVSSLEPEHLGHCLRALDLWVERSDVVVVDNASAPAESAEIRRLAAAHGTGVLRPHDLRDGSNTIEYIHEALKEVCAAHPDETILKVDEDILFATDPARIDPGPGELLVPAITINNFTTRGYLKALRPDLDEELRDHAWMWHSPHPTTGVVRQLDLLRFVYENDPSAFASVCAPAGTRETVDRSRWTDCALMGGPTDAEHRGISSTAIAFRARDYLQVAARCEHGIEEVILGEAVWQGSLRYVVDWSLYCHHVNYWPLRPVVKANQAYVSAYNDRVLEVLAARIVGSGRLAA